MADNYFNQLWELWNKLWKLRIVGNEQCIRPLFHCYLGVINPVKILNRGMFYSTRVNPFIIQMSSLGKGVMMDLLREITKDGYVHEIWRDKKTNEVKERDVPINPIQTLSVTTAGLIEQQITTKTGVITKEGILKNTRLLMFDEGRELYSKQQNYVDVRMALNMALDEKGGGAGFVSKITKGSGHIGFKTKVSICAGSVYDKEMVETVEEGFLQRCYLLLPEGNTAHGMVCNAFGLFGSSNKESKEILCKIAILKQQWEKEFVNIYFKNKDTKLPFIEVKQDAFEKMRRIFDEEYKNFVKGYFQGNKQNILESFLMRTYIIKAMSMAAHRAIFMLKPYIDEEDYQYGVEACRTHIESIKKILSGEPIEGAVLTGDERRKDIVLAVLKEVSPRGVSRKMFIIKLVKERRMGWDGGIAKLDEVLRDLEREDKITKKEVPTGNRGRSEYVYYLKQPTVEEETEEET